MAMPNTAPKIPCGPNPIEKFMANPASAEAINNQKPQRFHLRSATAEITLTSPQPDKVQKAQSGVFWPFRRNHPVPKRYTRHKAELMMITKTKYAVRHP